MRPLWARGATLYLAVVDSGVPLEGHRLELMRGRRRIAVAMVTRVVDGALAVARIDSGSVERERLDRLSVVALPTVAASSPALLRVGLPSSRRPSLLFACPAPAFIPPASAGRYAREDQGAGAWRWVRAERGPAGAWPDTLSVRSFDDAADEEIAFERGELDVALFWPGEISTAARQRLGAELELGMRPRGVLALQPAPGALPADSAARSLASIDMAPLNERLFRGDLAPWPAREASSDSVAGVPRPGRVRFRADASMPGARAIELVLAEGAGAPSAASAAVRVLYLDTPAEPADVVERSLRGLGVSPRFAVRGAMLVGPRAMTLVHSLGTEVVLARWGCDASELDP